MKAASIILLFAFLIVGCSSTWNLDDKYRGVIGAEFETRIDGHIWKMARHEYDLHPFKIWPSGSELGPAGTRLEFIPAGTRLRVLAAKRRYAGGDWDFLIAEIRAPESGKRYVIEELLGRSDFDPKEVDQHWRRVKEADPAATAQRH